MDLYKKLLFFSLFLILHVLASPGINSTTRTPPKMRPTSPNTTGNNMMDKIKQEISSNQVVAHSTRSLLKNSTIQNSSNSTNSVTEQNFTMSSVRTLMVNTTIKTSTSALKSGQPTNSPRLTAMDVTSGTFSFRNDSVSNSTSVYFTTETTLDNKTSNETSGKKNAFH